MGIISWIVIGLIVGLFGKFIIGAGKLLLGIVFGVLGAAFGGSVGLLFGIGAIAIFGLPSLFLALIGACLFMGIGKLLRGIFW